VNDKRVGSLWAPPYKIEITGLVKPGKNSIPIEVYNTAINELAKGGRLANIDGVTAQYGLRSRLQDFDNLQPQPSGIMLWGPHKTRFRALDGSREQPMGDGLNLALWPAESPKLRLVFYVSQLGFASDARYVVFELAELSPLAINAAGLR
jgi:hypothetical protein